jgi:hypothetical protein
MDPHSLAVLRTASAFTKVTADQMLTLTRRSFTGRVKTL